MTISEFKQFLEGFLDEKDWKNIGLTGEQMQRLMVKLNLLLNTVHKSPLHVPFEPLKPLTPFDTPYIHPKGEWDEIIKKFNERVREEQIKPLFPKQPDITMQQFGFNPRSFCDGRSSDRVVIS